MRKLLHQIAKQEERNRCNHSMIMMQTKSFQNISYSLDEPLEQSVNYDVKSFLKRSKKEKMQRKAAKKSSIENSKKVKE